MWFFNFKLGVSQRLTRPLSRIRNSLLGSTSFHILASYYSPLMAALGLRMSISHIELLRQTLESSKWIIVKELEGNDSTISATWLISRPNGDNQCHIVFEGLDESRVLPLNESYACHIKENESLNLYFNKINKGFSSYLEEFVKQLSVL